MLIEELRDVLVRDLRALRHELLAYGEDEAKIWDSPPGVVNSAGTLALHLTGNLRHYIGSQLGGTDYRRRREQEFAARNVPLAELIEGIDLALVEVTRVMDGLDAGDLDRTYPLDVGGVKLRTGDFLLHLATHLAYHLGQMDYHRRLVTGVGRTVRALNVRDLHSASSG